MGARIAAVLSALRPDLFTALILVAIAVAAVTPIKGEAAGAFAFATSIAIGVLFFLHGAKLSREAVIAGIGHWRFHLAALALTFVLFPIGGVLFAAFGTAALTPELVAGLVFLCVLPSTVQSSIAYTALAGGNVPAAVCGASLSNVAGVFITPLLASILIASQQTGTSALAGIGPVVMQILLPFIAGHLCRPLLLPLLTRLGSSLGWFDRIVIIAIVYRAFSAAFVDELWSRTPPLDLAILLAIVLAMLAAASFAAFALARALGFDHADRVALFFCGTQKSLASGAPMAAILFPAALAGPVLLPLMLYHQAQLMLGAALARRFAAEAPAPAPAPAAGQS